MILFPESETEPFEVFTLETAETLNVFPSGSTSFVNAFIVTALLVEVFVLSGFARGARFGIVVHTPGTT